MVTAIGTLGVSGVDDVAELQLGPTVVRFSVEGEAFGFSFLPVCLCLWVFYDGDWESDVF